MTRRYRAALAILTAIPMQGMAQGREAAPPLTRQAFASLRWLEGRWVGSGGGYAAFYEEYRFLNDSTIEQREIADSTFARVNRTSTIEYRGGAARKGRDGTIQSYIARVAGDTVRFETAVPGRRGFTWIRIGANEWRAILDTPNEPIVYTLRRYERR